MVILDEPEKIQHKYTYLIFLVLKHYNIDFLYLRFQKQVFCKKKKKMYRISFGYTPMYYIHLKILTLLLQSKEIAS